MKNMFFGTNPIIFKRAAELRNSMTSAERIIWQHIHINEWQLKFRRQHPIGNFIADFYCHQLKLIIEIDGDVHDSDEAKKYDIARENELKNLGLKIIRFRNEELFNQTKDVLKKIDEHISLLQNSPLGDGGKLFVIKIGGNIVDDPQKLTTFLTDFANLEGYKILVHGGGKLATRVAEGMGIEQQMVEGRRITDAETLKVVTMVYAGYINKTIVAQLQANGCNAIGLSGADGNAMAAHKRTGAKLDYGFVGDVDSINASLLTSLIEQGLTPVLSPITHDGKGQLLNTNADTIAQETAKGLSSYYDVELIYSFEKAGVLRNADDNSTVIASINPDSYKELKEQNVIFAGMIPKLDNAFSALQNGVQKVIIGKAEELTQLINGTSGTSIIND